MLTNDHEKYNRTDTWEILNQFSKFHSKLDEYVHSAKIMDEQTFRRTYENEQGSLPFIVIQLSNTPLSLYRSRLERKVGPKEDLLSPQTFSYVPLSLTNSYFPSLQRANFSGQSVFYGSLSPKTNFREISEDVTAGEEVYMAKWNISSDAKLMLCRVFSSRGILYNDNFRKIFKLDDENSDVFDSFFQKLGDKLMSTEEGCAKYLVSALYANFVYNLQPMFLTDGSKVKSFDGILYPSAKMVDGSEFNVAIKPKCIDRYATLQYVIRGKVSKDLHTVNYSDIGFCKGGEIHWYSPWIDHNDIIPTDIFIWDTNNCRVNIDSGVLYDKVGKMISNPWTVFEFQKDQWTDEYIKHFQSVLKCDYNLEELEEERLPNAIFRGHVMMREVDGWKLVSNDKAFEICKIGFGFQVKTTFKRTLRPNGVNWV